MDSAVCTEIIAIAPLEDGEYYENVEDYEETTGQEGRRLKCGHVFHAHCIDRWVSTRLLDQYRRSFIGLGRPPTCPNCRDPLMGPEKVSSASDYVKAFLEISLAMCIRALDVMKYGDVTEAVLKELLDISATVPKILTQAFLVCRNEYIIEGYPMDDLAPYREFVAQSLLYSLEVHNDNVHCTGDLEADADYANTTVFVHGLYDLDMISSYPKAVRTFCGLIIDACKGFEALVENE